MGSKFFKKMSGIIMGLFTMAPKVVELDNPRSGPEEIQQARFDGGSRQSTDKVLYNISI